VKKSSLTPEKADKEPPQWESPFARNFEKVFFRASMEVKGKRLTGIALVKKTSDTSYHFAFTNEIGITYLDLEIFKSTFRKDYVFGPLDRNSLLRILHYDLSLLFFKDHSIGRARRYKDPATLDDVYYYRSQKFFVFLKKSNRRIMRMAGWTNLFDAALIGFQYEEDVFPSGITIMNPRIGLLFDLNVLGR
jgi:hypothetical protein